MGAALETECIFCGRRSTEVSLVVPEGGAGGICLGCARSAVESFERAEAEAAQDAAKCEACGYRYDEHNWSGPGCDAFRAPGERPWMLFEVEGDPETHAAPADKKATFCDRPVTFPVGSGRPSCPRCLTEVDRLDPEETP